MEVKNNNLFDQYLTANDLSEEQLSPLETKYINLLCPIIERKIHDAGIFFTQYKACRIDISSLAKELGVSRPTIYKDGIIDFLDYCKALMPGLHSSEEIKRLTKKVEENEERLKEFRLKDYNNEELKVQVMSSEKTINENNTKIKNLEKELSMLRKENIELKKKIKAEEPHKKEEKPKSHIQIDMVNGHIKKGPHVKKG